MAVDNRLLKILEKKINQGKITLDKVKLPEYVEAYNTKKKK